MTSLVNLLAARGRVPKWKPRIKLALAGIAIVSLHYRFRTHVRFVLNEVRYGLSLYGINPTKHFSPLPEGMEHPNFTFPSVEERVRYYMGDYYNAGSWLNNSTDLCRDIPVCRPENAKCSLDTPYIFDARALGFMRDKFNPSIERDAQKYFSNEDDDVNRNNGTHNRIIFQLGDSLVSDRNARYPVIVKARSTLDPEKSKTAPILGFLRVWRHYGQLSSVRKFFPWEAKKDTMVFRGATTGNRLEILRPFVLGHANGNGDFDFGFEKIVQRGGLALNDTEREALRGNFLSTRQLTQYKYLLVLTGNDVSTGLKWMLYSNSVVFMPPPRAVSWALEEYLVPYVHYVPVREDLADLKAQLEWARQNDGLCQNITKHATQFMIHLYASEKALEDNKEIRRLIAKRYHQMYGPAIDQCR